MPTYEYRCEHCGHTVEKVQSFTDSPLTTCESCGGALRKVYAPVGIVFKGSGFYKTDSRSSSKAKSNAGAPSSDGGDAAAPASTEKTDRADKKGTTEPSPSSTSSTSQKEPGSKRGPVPTATAATPKGD
jgi:putative FmdB family regulatory protein